MAKAFTVAFIKSAPDGRYADGGCKGLYLEVRGGSRLFYHRYKMNLKSYTVGLGSITVATLADARQAVAANRAAITKGQNPKAVRTPVSVATDTFRHDALAYYESKLGGWVEAHARQWLSRFERLVFPTLGDKPTACIKAADIAETLRPIWKDMYPTARVTLIDIAAIIDHAILIDDEDHPRFNRPNPTAKVWPILGTVVHRQTGHPALPYENAPAFYKRLCEIDDQAATALRFMLLCCTPRSNEITGALWSEIHCNVFRVAAERMKALKAEKNERDIPLVQEAVDLLAAIPDKDGFIFKGRAGKRIKFSGAMHDDRMNELMREMFGTIEIDGKQTAKYDVHGLRSTFSTWVKDVHPNMISARDVALAHTTGNKVDRAYDRAFMLNERRILAEKWAAFLTADSSPSVPLENPSNRANVSH